LYTADRRSFTLRRNGFLEKLFFFFLTLYEPSFRCLAVNIFAFQMRVSQSNRGGGIYYYYYNIMGIQATRQVVNADIRLIGSLLHCSRTDDRQADVILYACEDDAQNTRAVLSSET